MRKVTNAVDPAKFVAASMGPQHESCGKRAPPANPSTFWGLQWGRNMRVAESRRHERGRRRHDASMGPQHESCGKRHVGSRRNRDVCASMGPQHESCGKVFGQLCFSRCLVASMGPQHESCGKQGKRSGEGDNKWLQWGRNMRVAESGHGYRSVDRPARASMGPQHESCGKAGDAIVVAKKGMLQWGRNMRVAERGAERRAPPVRDRFNGAAT